jgi:hypothetical protein
MYGHGSVIDREGVKDSLDKPQLSLSQEWRHFRVDMGTLFMKITHPAPPHVMETRITRTESLCWNAFRASVLLGRDVFPSIRV